MGITVKRLIEILSEYPMDKKVHVNEIGENLKGELVFRYYNPETEEYFRRKEKEREEERERGRDMPTFADRW